MTDRPIQLAVDYLQGGGKKPNSQAVVSALLAAERQSRREKSQYKYDDLVGKWRLGFVSGTQTVRSSPKALPVKKPGKGRFIPGFLTVEIIYKKEEDAASLASSSANPDSPNVRLNSVEINSAEINSAEINSVENRVIAGPLSICLSGPTLFRAKLNALVFDFTKLAVSLGGWTPYSGSIRGGEESRQAFETRSLKEQAFFTFFLVEDSYIAARGKGGGLALWTR